VARAKFIDDGEFSLIMAKAIAGTEKVARAALIAGAGVIADRMKQNLKGVLSEDATGQLVEAFGITPVLQDRELNWNVHLGFDGYQPPPQKKWPKGVPFQLIARVIENGTDWRPARPFAKTAVQATKQQTLEAMKQAAEKELKKMSERR
jgi:hypothetical protein